MEAPPSILEETPLRTLPVLTYLCFGLPLDIIQWAAQLTYKLIIRAVASWLQPQRPLPVFNAQKSKALFIEGPRDVTDWLLDYLELYWTTKVHQELEQISDIDSLSSFHLSYYSPSDSSDSSDSSVDFGHQL